MGVVALQRLPIKASADSQAGVAQVQVPAGLAGSGGGFGATAGAGVVLMRSSIWSSTYSNVTLLPLRIPSCWRILRGMVTCPLLVTEVITSIS